MIKACIICNKKTKKIKGRAHTLHKSDSSDKKKQINDLLQANNAASSNGAFYYHQSCLNNLERQQRSASQEKVTAAIDQNSILNSAFTYICGYVKKYIIVNGEIKTLLTEVIKIFNYLLTALIFIFCNLNLCAFIIIYIIYQCFRFMNSSAKGIIIWQELLVYHPLRQVCIVAIIYWLNYNQK